MTKKLYANRKTSEKKNKYIRARVTESEKQLIENHAFLKGMKISDYIMDLIIKDMNGNQE